MDEKRLIKIARLYYELNKTQKEIADSENLSRTKVSRMLQKAKDMGLVEIRIKAPLTSVYELESELMNKFPLKKVIVIPVTINNKQIIYNDVGKAVSNFLKDIIKDGDIIGVSWGNTMSCVADNLPIYDFSDIKVVQLNGGMSHTKISTTAHNIVDKFAQSFRAEPYIMPVPAIVDNKNIADTLLTDSKIVHIFSLCKKARIALFGIGYPSTESVLYKAGYFDSDSFEQLLNSGAVGDICSRYFDIEGNLCCPSINDRTIGISLEDLKQKEYSIAVATGERKVKPIIGALNGRYINTLVTDEHTAKAVLDYL